MADDEQTEGDRRSRIDGPRRARTRQRRPSSWTTARPASSGRCATARRTSWPRPSSTSSRAPSSASGRSSRTASTTTSCCPRPLTPDDLPTIEERMRESIAADHPFEFSARRPRKRPGRRSSSATSRSRSRSSTTSSPPSKRDGTADAADDLLPAGPVHRPVSRPARGEHRQDRPVQAARHGRRVLARRREAADAPARLRHGLGDAGGARRLPLASRGGEEARPSPARRPARPVLVPRRLPRFRVLASEGPADLAHARGGHARAAGASRLPGGLDADRRVGAPVAPVGPLGPVPRQHVPGRVREPDVQPQADELPGIDVHLPLASALVPRPAAALQRVRAAPSERTLRARCPD